MFQGGTVKPLLNYFKIDREQKTDNSMLTEINGNVSKFLKLVDEISCNIFSRQIMDHVMDGVELIMGQKGKNHIAVSHHHHLRS